MPAIYTNEIVTDVVTGDITFSLICRGMDNREAYEAVDALRKLGLKSSIQVDNTDPLLPVLLVRQDIFIDVVSTPLVPSLQAGFEAEMVRFKSLCDIYYTETEDIADNGSVIAGMLAESFARVFP